MTMRLRFAHTGLDRRLALGLGLMLVPLVVACALSLGLLHSAGVAFTHKRRGGA